MRAPPLRVRINKAALQKLYNEKGLSTVDIARRYSSHSPNVIALMEKYGIPRRSTGAGKPKDGPATV